MTVKTDLADSQESARRERFEPVSGIGSTNTQQAIEESTKPAGRPSLYKPEYVEQAKKLCALGATDIELADFFKVDISTLYRWKNEFDEFCKAIKVAKGVADARVERSLYERATGYSYPAVKIFQYEGSPVEVPYREHVPPDTTAMIFWLKNRKPKEWRDRHMVEHDIAEGGILQSILDLINNKPEDKPK